MVRYPIPSIVGITADDKYVKADWDTRTPTTDFEYTHDAEAEYPVISASQQKGLQRKFDKRKQLRKLLVIGFLRWALTSFLIAMIYVSLNHFTEKEVMRQVWGR